MAAADSATANRKTLKAGIILFTRCANSGGKSLQKVADGLKQIRIH